MWTWRRRATAPPLRVSTLHTLLIIAAPHLGAGCICEQQQRAALLALPGARACCKHAVYTSLLLSPCFGACS